MKTTSILIIYTGGTVGMFTNPETGALSPFNFEHIVKFVPELQQFDFELTTVSFPPVDSSNIKPELWTKLAQTIQENYCDYDGFVILHGTDTMSFTASALSFMLENLSKPVILTGSQLPIGMLRTDGKENLITAIQIAAAKRNNQPIVAEVCVFFGSKLYRGNRTSKYNTEYFGAFHSPNYPILAESGINIRYFHNQLLYQNKHWPLRIHTKLETNIVVLKMFPGINENTIHAILQIKDLRAVVLETYGAGNAITDKWFVDLIRQAIENEIVILNITQCNSGSVNMGRYETSIQLREIGVLSGHDMTTEAALCKLMMLLGSNISKEGLKKYLTASMAGEMTVKQKPA